MEDGGNFPHRGYPRLPKADYAAAAAEFYERSMADLTYAMGRLPDSARRQGMP